MQVWCGICEVCIIIVVVIIRAIVAIGIKIYFGYFDIADIFQRIIYDFACIKYIWECRFSSIRACFKIIIIGTFAIDLAGNIYPYSCAWNITAYITIYRYCSSCADDIAIYIAGYIYCSACADNIAVYIAGYCDYCFYSGNISAYIAFYIYGDIGYSRIIVQSDDPFSKVVPDTDTDKAKWDLGGLMLQFRFSFGVINQK